MDVLVKAVFLTCCISIIQGKQTGGPRARIEVSSSVGVLRRFWDSTGLCPPAPRSSAARFMLSHDELYNLALIGSMPDRAISQVRIHWLLDMINVSSVNAFGDPEYNFKFLDLLFDWMKLFRLNPGFELMGNPSQFFSNFSDAKQVHQWSQLVRQIASNYIDRYGMKSVSAWRFETWNEPDLRGYNIFNFTLESYLRYFTACTEGLHAAGNGSLRLGGPAGLFKAPDKHPLCWGLLQHCVNLTTCPLDYISFHKKGGGSSKDVLEKDVQLAQDIKLKFPALASIPLVNDEADPLTGWSKNLSWRGDVRYGAMVASLIVSHQQVMVRKLGMRLELVSSDNAFLNYHPFYFSQRTLLARFQMNNTSPRHAQFFKKPIYTTMALLSFLGSQEIDVAIKKKDERLSILATAGYEYGVWSSAVLLVFNNDTVSNPNEVLNVTLMIPNLPNATAKYVLYLLDNTITNPQQEWAAAGYPVFPDQLTRVRIRAAEGPHRVRGPSLVPQSRKLRLALQLKLPSVALLHVCSSSTQLPGQVERLMICNVTQNEVLLFWGDESVKTRCIKTYEVELKASNSTQFRRINSEDTIFLSFHYSVVSGRDEVSGEYRVRAVDYWGRAGPYSSSVPYPGLFPCP